MSKTKILWIVMSAFLLLVSLGGGVGWFMITHHRSSSAARQTTAVAGASTLKSSSQQSGSASSLQVDSGRGKVRFGSDAAAQAALKKINPSKALNKPRRVYKCPVCAGWHLTSKKL